jgi:hypothetical protein
VNKQGSHKFHKERFNLKKLYKVRVEGKEKYCVEVSNKFAALEDLDVEVEINTIWETIRENIKISVKESLGYYELKQYKPWFDEGCSELLDQRKQAKLQWSKDPSEKHGDNPNNVRRETSRHFRNTKKEYLKGKINELATNSKNKNVRDLYRGINVFKSGYQPRSNFVKDENGDLLADSNTILNRSKSYFSQLLNVHDVNDVRQIEIHTAEPLVPGPSHFEVEISIAKLKKYKSPGRDQIPAELYQAGGETLVSVIHKLITSVEMRKKCLISGRSLLLYQFTRWVMKLTNNYRGISLLSTSYKIL